MTLAANPVRQKGFAIFSGSLNTEQAARLITWLCHLNDIHKDDKYSTSKIGNTF
jgi:hypothetical protein